MSVLAELESIKKSLAPPCRVGEALAKFPKLEREELVNVITELSYGVGVIQQFFKTHGDIVSNESLLKHRRKLCNCP